MNRSVILIVFAAAWMLSACESGTRMHQGSVATVEETLPGLQYAAPAAWEQQDPSSDARAMQYSLGAVEDAGDSAELVFYYFGERGAGSVEDNLDRWINQFDAADRSVTDTRVWTRYGIRVHEVVVDGTYVARVTPTSDERLHIPDHAMRAAVVETDAGPYYVKLTGPRATVDDWQRAWSRMLQSFRPAPVEPGDAEAAPDHPVNNGS